MRRPDANLYELIAALSKGEIRSLRLEMSRLKLKGKKYREYFDFLVMHCQRKPLDQPLLKTWTAVVHEQEAAFAQAYGGQISVLKNYLYRTILRYLQLQTLSKGYLWLHEGESLLSKGLRNQAIQRLQKASRHFPKIRELEMYPLLRKMLVQIRSMKIEVEELKKLKVDFGMIWGIWSL